MYYDLASICAALPASTSGDVSTQASAILSVLTGESASFNISDVQNIKRYGTFNGYDTFSYNFSSTQQRVYNVSTVEGWECYVNLSDVLSVITNNNTWVFSHGGYSYRCIAVISNCFQIVRVTGTVYCAFVGYRVADNKMYFKWFCAPASNLNQVEEMSTIIQNGSSFYTSSGGIPQNVGDLIILNPSAAFTGSMGMVFTSSTSRDSTNQIGNMAFDNVKTNALVTTKSDVTFGYLGFTYITSGYTSGMRPTVYSVGSSPDRLAVI